MTMRTVFWACLVLSLVPLTVGAWEFVQYRRRGQMIPPLTKALSVFGVGYVFFFASYLLTYEALRWAALTGSIACFGYSVVLMRRARADAKRSAI